MFPPQAQRENRNWFSRKENSHSPKHRPRVRLTAAPLSAVARWDFISVLLTAKRAKSLL